MCLLNIKLRIVAINQKFTRVLKAQIVTNFLKSIIGSYTKIKLGSLL